MGVSLTSPKWYQLTACEEAREANYALHKRKSALLAIRAWRGLLWHYNGGKPKGVDLVKGLHVRLRVDRRKHHR